jgi:hypothetical protein
LSEQEWLIAAKGKLNEESHKLVIERIGAIAQKSTVGEEDKALLRKLDEGDNRFALVQQVFEENFAHINFLIPSTTNKTKEVTQIASYRTENEIAAGPFLFPNHLNGKMDILFQDRTLQLHLLNDKGQLQWSKQLDGELMGELNAVDAYRNDRKQMVFSTNKSIYFLDRNGNDLNKYPISPSGGLSQPVSVFDYDGNRKYRFLATSGDKLLMYDYMGDRITGFKYSPSGKITSQPAHYRNGKLDYIIFSDEKNGLNILNRVGKTRTSVDSILVLKSPLQFSKNLILALDSKGYFTEVNLNNGEIKKIEKLGNGKLRVVDNKRVVLSSQTLAIGKKEVDLDYGDFQNFNIQNLSDQLLISMINESNKEVLVYDHNASLLPGFPIYGEQYVEVGLAKKHYLVTRDGNDILIYQW